MNGVIISFDKIRIYINFLLLFLDFDKEVDEWVIKFELEKGEIKCLFVLDMVLKLVCDIVNYYFKIGDGIVVQECIGEWKNVEVVYCIFEDGMFVNLVFIMFYGGKFFSLGILKFFVIKNNICCGLGIKII